jgi:hypothetical protein
MNTVATRQRARIKALNNCLNTKKPLDIRNFAVK